MTSVDMEPESLENKPASGISYFTPAQEPPAGTALGMVQDGKAMPKLFQPLKLRGLTLHNRIMLSPLCQYSADDGHYTMWHFAHMGGIIQRGPGLTTVEATAVLPEGRITPQDSGLWKDSQKEPLRKVVEFAHSQGQKIMIQLAHAGRKASTVAPWVSKSATATEELGGWPNNVVGPSPIPFSPTFPPVRSMTQSDIAAVKAAFAQAAQRAVAVGFDALEIHAAHGYLLGSFLSAATNRRDDGYGGRALAGRARLLLETVAAVRAVMPGGMPLLVRVSATEWLEGHADAELAGRGWTVGETVRLARMLAEQGLVDALDVSSGGNHAEQRIETGPAFQARFAEEVKRAVGDSLAVGTVGMVTSGTLAEECLTGKGLDFVAVGRGFQRNPGLVWDWGDELGVRVRMPNQIRWGFEGRGKKED